MSEKPPSALNPALTHFDAEGQAHMVDVAAKGETRRVAVAAGRILMQPATFEMVAAGSRIRATYDCVRNP